MASSDDDWEEIPMEDEKSSDYSDMIKAKPELAKVLLERREDLAKPKQDVMVTILATVEKMQQSLERFLEGGLTPEIGEATLYTTPVSQTMDRCTFYHRWISLYKAIDIYDTFQDLLGKIGVKQNYRNGTLINLLREIKFCKTHNTWTVEFPENMDAVNNRGESLLVRAGYHSPKALKYLLTLPNVDVNRAKENGRTALTYAVYRSLEAVKDLLAHPNIDINQQCFKTGYTPLMFSMGKVPDTAILLLERPEIEVNLIGRHGTALHIAAIHCPPGVIPLLLAKGADQTVRDHEGKTAYEVLLKYHPDKVYLFMM